MTATKAAESLTLTKPEYDRLRANDPRILGRIIATASRTIWSRCGVAYYGLTLTQVETAWRAIEGR